MIFLREKLTFGIVNTRNRKLYLLQFTLKNPWLIPKCDKNYGKEKNIVLYGWTFVYFGYSDCLR